MSATDTDPIIVTTSQRVRVLTINRPDTLNAMNNVVFAGIADALAAAAESTEVAVTVITGQGRAFSAGQDLTELLDHHQSDANTYAFPRMLEQLAHFRKPLIAAVNGLGVGIGMTLLAHCDLVFMSVDARLKTPFPQLGLAPEAGSSFTFAERMGWQNAAYTLMSGRWFNAEECHAMGLVWRISPADKLMHEVMEVAHEIAANPIPSLVATKELMLASGRTQNAWAAHEREREAYQTLLGAPANQEAVNAFVEKRPAEFEKIKGI